MSASNALAAAARIDLSAQQLSEVQRILRNVFVQQDGAGELVAWVFGSRATAKARPCSDLDVLIGAAHPMDWRTRSDLADAFEASSLPFRVDVVHEAALWANLAPRVMAERIRL